MGLELVTYNITFKWISGAQNKAADCLFRLVELPQDKQATVQVLIATNLDGLALHTRSITAQHNITEDLTVQPKTDTVTPVITTVQDTPDNTPKLLTIDYKHYYKCKEPTHFVNAFPSIYQMAKHQNMKLIFFYTSSNYCINMS